ncbi:MAG: VIT domain-containing protein [Chloroflexia bacterium]
MKRCWLLAAAALLAALFFSPAARGDGLIIIDPVPPGRPAYLTVVYHHVEVTIEDQVAVTRIDQLFRNDQETTVEGTYIFPLPEEASIQRFAMYVDGKPLEGKVLSREEARAIYESIVRRNRDPALLEYVGRNAFQASIFPIAPHEEKRIQIEYAQLLPAEQGLVEYVYPLNTERFSPQPIEDVAITVRLQSKEPLTAIYSPSHEVKITRDGNHRATIGYEERDALPERDFVLYYAVSAEDVGVNLLTYRTRGEDGFFLLLVAPPADAADRKVVAKDVLLVLDTSGSMDGEKIEQAKAALAFVLSHLNADDRFAVIAFHSAVSTYADRLLPASERAGALQYVEGLAAGGSTDIDGALARALDLADRESTRPQLILFLTDGLPTVGEQDTARILENVRRRASPNIRLFAFGVGYDVNSALLDALAQENHGASTYILPGENLEERVSAFYSKIESPVLTHLELDLDIPVWDTYPHSLPDLFLGSQLVWVGRYREARSTTLVLRGRVNGEDRIYRYEDLTFPEEDMHRDFIPRLWAMRKIGYLLNEIRLHGENPELIDEIVELSLRYGVITPYTSFLVDETGRVLTERGLEESKQAFGAAIPVLAPEVGADGVTYSLERQRLSESETAYASARPAGLRQVGERTFLQVSGVWTDTTYRQGTPTRKVTFGSDTYFALAARNPQWARYLSLGERVIVVLDGAAYEVVPEDVPPVPLPADPTPTAGPSPSITPGPSAVRELPGGVAVLLLAGVAGLAVGAGLLIGRRR